MNLSIGIVGLPNVGKSTLFNALLKKQQAFVANYPFATIEPNIGIVPVPDSRLQKLAEIINLSLGNPPSLASELAGSASSDTHPSRSSESPSSVPIVPATVRFVDIAGLVKGAAQGEGLGNKFLSHIREVDAIFQVVRYFKSADVHHVNGAPNPENDLAVINMELILADLETLAKQHEPKRNSTKEEVIKWEGIKKLKKGLDEEKLAKDVQLTDEEKIQVKELQLLTMKPMVIVLNIGEEDYIPDNINSMTDQYTGILVIDRKNFVPICAKIESELSQLSEEEQREYLKSLGFEESGLERIIKKGYEILDLISFLTAGEKEVRAWTIEKSSNAVEAAGTIHTDFMKKFIKAEIVAFEDFVVNNGWKGSREKGKARFEGKDYIMKDGDVVEFKIGS